MDKKTLSCYWLKRLLNVEYCIALKPLTCKTCCVTKMASNDRVTRVTIDCVETIIDGNPVILFNCPSPVEGREMICVPPTQNGNYCFSICSVHYICFNTMFYLV